MAQVLPAERDLRRVIGDGDSVPDGEVEGLADHDLVELYRSLVLLRTYDERSVVYHSQGRIGTYAIYWNHEAMQAGSVYALEDDDWIFPSYRESAIGLLRGMPASTVLSWWRGHPVGWWNPADYNVASICVPIGTHVPARRGPGLGQAAARGDRVRDRILRGRRDLRGRVPRGRELRGRHARTARPLLQQQRVGDLDPRGGADPRGDARGQGRRVRDARASGRRARHPGRLRSDAGGGCARPRRRGADVHRGGQLPGGAARHGGRSEGVHRPRAGRGGEETRVRGPLRGVPASSGDPHRRDGRVDPRRGRAGDARRDRSGGG